MSKLINNIKQLARLVKNENISGANTSVRVGGLFEEIASELELKYDQAESEQTLAVHNTATGSHQNIQDRIDHDFNTLNQQLTGKINDVNAKLTAADGQIYQDLSAHTRDSDIHKTSQQIRSEIADSDIPATLARIADVNIKDSAILQSAKTYTDNSVNTLSSNVYPKTETYTRVEIDTRDTTTLNTSKEYAIGKIAELVGGSPATLNTLFKLATAVNNDPNFAQSITAIINDKAALGHSHTASQVSEEANRYFMTNTERNKLSGIEVGANLYTHPATHPASIITDTAEKVIMTTAERSKLSGIQTGANLYTHPDTHSASIVTEVQNKYFMTDAERDKLSGIQAEANLYTHPDTHPASIITEVIDRHFITDAERDKLSKIQEETVYNYILSIVMGNPPYYNIALNDDKNPIQQALLLSTSNGIIELTFRDNFTSKFQAMCMATTAAYTTVWRPNLNKIGIMNAYFNGTTWAVQTPLILFIKIIG